ncbi:hypothetical protein H1R20_g3446, partial [Candolleomyces eurysporus]
MWDSFIALSLGIGFVLFARTIVVRRKRNPRGLPLPPGPKGLPLLGNVFQLPQAKPWEGYQKLCEEYGDMIYLTALGSGILVIGSHRRAVDLLDKRSANYSDRPASPIFEMTGLGWSLALMRYGTRWRQHSRAFHKYFTPTAVQQYHPIMYEETKAYLRKVNSHPNDIFEDTQFLPEESDPNYTALETVARNVSGGAFIAGAETTGNSGVALLYVLASYPEVQAKAQAEIDAVVGSNRLPLITDRENLPYVHALVKEVSRWYTVLPTGVPHCNSEDDEYDGYFIPKGTVILQNNWAMMHDPDVFEKPFEFIPERYIKDGKIDFSVSDASRAAFGHGRRNDALFLLAASLLATHTLVAPKDEKGNIAPMKLSESENQVVSKPLPFKCEVTLRPGRKHLLE